MKLNVEYAKDPVWADEAQTIIDLKVKFIEYTEELPFTASSTDTEEHGIWLYNESIAGKYGQIGLYSKPTINITQTTPPVQNTTLTPIQFINRFTETEQLALITATMSIPSIKLWYDKLLLSKSVLLTSPQLSSNLDTLVDNNIITAQRKNEILTP